MCFILDLSSLFYVDDGLHKTPHTKIGKGDGFWQQGREILKFLKLIAKASIAFTNPSLRKVFVLAVSCIGRPVVGDTEQYCVRKIFYILEMVNGLNIQIMTKLC